MYRRYSLILVQLNLRQDQWEKSWGWGITSDLAPLPILGSYNSQGGWHFHLDLPVPFPCCSRPSPMSQAHSYLPIPRNLRLLFQRWDGGEVRAVPKGLHAFLTAVSVHFSKACSQERHSSVTCLVPSSLSWAPGKVCGLPAHEWILALLFLCCHSAFGTLKCSWIFFLPVYMTSSICSRYISHPVY